MLEDKINKTLWLTFDKFCEFWIKWYCFPIFFNILGLKYHLYPTTSELSYLLEIKMVFIVLQQQSLQGMSRKVRHHLLMSTALKKLLWLTATLHCVFSWSHLLRLVSHHSLTISTCLFSMNFGSSKCEQHLIIDSFLYWKWQDLIHVFVKQTVRWRWRLNTDLKSVPVPWPW